MLTSLVFFWLLFIVEAFSQTINCHDYVQCNNCANQTKCGWCELLGVCVAGNSTGPYSGSCDWIYDKCPTTTTTPPTHDIPWYAFGGNQQHTGYVPYSTPITDKTKIEIVYHKAWDTQMISPITTYRNNIYYWSGDQDTSTNSSAVYCDSLENGEIIWRTDLNVNISYCSQPSLTKNITFLVLSCYYLTSTSYNPTINLQTIILNVHNGTLIPNTFQGRISNIYTYLPKYSPLIADNLNMFMINYNNRSLGVYNIYPFGKIWNQQIGDYMGSTVSSYNPSNNIFYTQHGVTYSYGFRDQVTVSQWMNGPLVSYNTSEYISSSWKQNTPVVMSLKYNITFTVGASICGEQWNNNVFPPTMIELWCKSLGSAKYASIPAIDEEEGVVYFWFSSIYSQYIQALDMFNGTVIREYNNGNGITSYCYWRYGGYYTQIQACLGTQPLIVENNFFWTDGIDIIIFDKISKYVVNRINAPCNISGVNRGILFSWSNDNLIVNCFNSIIAYTFS